jgi:hypothetical protein
MTDFPRRHASSAPPFSGFRPQEEDMFRSLLVVFLFGASAAAGAQALTFADVKAKNATQLTADELRELMPGAKVVSRTQAGSTRYWQNKPDGTFTASSDGRGSCGGRNCSSTAPGTWRVQDNGTLCVTIKWPTAQDDWCRYIFKAGDKYYGVGRREDSAAASEFEFSK